MESKLIYPIVGAISVAGLFSCKSKKLVEDGKPLNIVFIMTDDHTAQMMSCFDKRFAHTPNLDRIANDGVRFTNSFVCNSISGPSRAAMLTGKHSHKNGKSDNHSVFDGRQQTMPKLLQQAGYQTALFGKWHLDSTPTGFDTWEVLPGQGDYYNPDFIRNNDTVRYQGYVTNIITDLSLDWMQNKRDKDKPFCLFIHHKAIHRNWMADTTHLALFENNEYPYPENFFDNYEGRAAAAKQEMSIYKDMDLIYDLKMLKDTENSRLKKLYYANDSTGIYGRMNKEQKKAWNNFYTPIIKDFYSKKLQGKELAKWKYQRYIKDYLKTVQSLDENVGRVLDYLEKEGMLENTLVVYTSDQGFYMGEHGWFDKRFMYEESMRTPLIMRLPKKFSKRGDIEQMVQNIDYAPTFLDIAGVKIPSDMQGVSLLPLLKGENPADWRKSLYYHYYEFPGEHKVRKHYGVRTPDYKLIHFYGDIDTWELYDMKNDPKEMNNLYGKPGMEKILRRLKAELSLLQKKYDLPNRD